MEEKRKHKRLELDVTVELERLDEDGVTTLRYSHVEVVDISRTGIGLKQDSGLRLERTTTQRFRFGQKRLLML